MDKREREAYPIDNILGVNDSISPIKKDGTVADIIDNFELSEDLALTSRLGSYLVDRATRLRMSDNAAFVVDEFVGNAGSVAIGTYHYIFRYYAPILTKFSLPSPTRSAVVVNASSSILVQAWLRNNPDRTLYTELHLYRTSGDAYSSTYKRVQVFTAEVAAESYIRFIDTNSDAAISGNPSVILDDTGLAVDHAVADIIDFKRRIGGNDILFVAGKYIKSFEKGNYIYDALTPDRLGSHVIFQNAVWYVNGKDFICINERLLIFNIGGTSPLNAPNVSRTSGPLNGNYRWVITYYDNGSVTGHPWESNSSPISATLNLANNGALITLDTAGMPSRTTHWRIFRTSSDGAIEAALLVVQLPIGTTTYVDTRPDITLGPDVAPFDYNDSPADLKLRFIWEHDDRLYGAGNPDSPSTLYWTLRGKPEQWSELNNRLTLSENDGDPILGGCVIDGKNIVLKKDSVYAILDSPPVGANKLGFKQGTCSFRTVQPTQNGVFTESENSLYYFNGNAMYDVADFISRFIQRDVDATESTMRSPQLIDYQLPTKKQLICSFRTLGEGIVNKVAGIYHYKIAQKLGELNLGWTFFRNFKVSSMGIIEDSFDKDMLYLGTEDGRVFVHDRIEGQDRAEIENMGAAGAPFIDPVNAIANILNNPFNSLTGITSSGVGSATYNNIPAGFLHLGVPSGTNGRGLVFLTTASGNNPSSGTLTFDTLNFTSLSGDGFGINIGLACGDLRGHYQFQLGTSGIYITPPTLDGSSTIAARVLNTTLLFATGINYNITMEFFDDLSFTGRFNRHLIMIVNSVVIFSGYIGGGETTGQTFIVQTSVNGDTTQSPPGAVEYTLDRLAFDMFSEHHTAIERHIDGEPISMVYESPWLNFGSAHLQKFLKEIFSIIRANYNGTVRLLIYSDLVPGEPHIEDIPVNGGSLWDVMQWDQSILDGLKRTVNERVNVERTGNNFKLRVEINQLSSYVEIFGNTLLYNPRSDQFEAARGNEGVAETV